MRTWLGFFAVLGLLTLATVDASAKSDWGNEKGGPNGHDNGRGNDHGNGHGSRGGGDWFPGHGDWGLGHGGGHPTVPEINTSGSSAALVLLLSGVAVATGARKRKTNKSHS